MDSIKVFEELALEYDKWFDENRFVYESELRAMKRHLPKGFGIEIGVGTGRFAVPLGVNIGVEPAKNMAQIARGRGLEVVEAKAEMLPFRNNIFDYALIVVTICFVENPIKVLEEMKRIIKPNGSLIIGLIDKDSFLGKIYELKKNKSRFYKYAKFYSTEQVINWLKELGFNHIKTSQTIFKQLEEITNIEPIKDGYGKGGFVVLSSLK